MSIRGKLISALAQNPKAIARETVPEILEENRALKKQVRELRATLRGKSAEAKEFRAALKGLQAALNEKAAAAGPTFDPLVVLEDAGGTYKFHCETDKERNRARRLFTKEKGTVNWIARDARPGDTFFDIGANIGLYTVYAAARIGATGTVYAFEPHASNFAALIKTIDANGFSDFVYPISLPLGDRVGSAISTTRASWHHPRLASSKAIRMRGRNLFLSSASSNTA